LLDEDPPLALDLQAVFDRFYDENAYGRGLDYRGDPVPPLKDEAAGWARDLLVRAGRLSA
jgi:hypothetical protein